MWDQDWDNPGLKIKKAKKTGKNKAKDLTEREFMPEQLKNDVSQLYKNQPRCPEYPKWYQELHEKDENGNWTFTGLTARKNIVPKLLRLTWMGYPLHRDETEKWGYLVPKKEDIKKSSSATDETEEEDLGSLTYDAGISDVDWSGEEKLTDEKGKFPTEGKCNKPGFTFSEYFCGKLIAIHMFRIGRLFENNISP